MRLNGAGDQRLLGAGWKGETEGRLSRKPAPGREPLILVAQQGTAGDLSVPYSLVIAELPAVAWVSGPYLEAAER